MLPNIFWLMELQAGQQHSSSVVKSPHLGLLHRNKGEAGGTHSADEEEGGRLASVSSTSEVWLSSLVDGERMESTILTRGGIGAAQNKRARSLWGLAF